eukprot:scaffold195_cov359-Prasinococcus_capsulatus_cf.AAC.1
MTRGPAGRARPCTARGRGGVPPSEVWIRFAPQRDMPAQAQHGAAPRSAARDRPPRTSPPPRGARPPLATILGAQPNSQLVSRTRALPRAAGPSSAVARKGRKGGRPACLPSLLPSLTTARRAPPCAPGCGLGRAVAAAATGGGGWRLLLLLRLRLLLQPPLRL